MKPAAPVEASEQNHYPIPEPRRQTPDRQTAATLRDARRLINNSTPLMFVENHSNGVFADHSPAKLASCGKKVSLLLGGKNLSEVALGAGCSSGAADKVQWL